MNEPDVESDSGSERRQPTSAELGNAAVPSRRSQRPRYAPGDGARCRVWPAGNTSSCSSPRRRRCLHKYSKSAAGPTAIGPSKTIDSIRSIPCQRARPAAREPAIPSTSEYPFGALSRRSRRTTPRHHGTGFSPNGSDTFAPGRKRSSSSGYLDSTWHRTQPTSAPFCECSTHPRVRPIVAVLRRLLSPRIDLVANMAGLVAAAASPAMRASRCSRASLAFRTSCGGPPHLPARSCIRREAGARRADAATVGGRHRASLACRRVLTARRSARGRVGGVLVGGREIRWPVCAGRGQ